MRQIQLCWLVLFLCISQKSLADTYLLMAEEDGCYWCARWDTEIAQIYPKTEEGRQIPLRRYDLMGATPAGVELARRVVFTPTFILVQNNIEVGRIEGYPGEDFFWGLLTMMIKDANIKVTSSR